MDSSTKSMKVSRLIRHRDATDYLTNIDEDILSNILSRLPTKDAVRTSILSKDWVYKWTSSYNMDIDDRSSPSRIRAAGMFADFVDRVLRFTKHLKGFSLRCGILYDVDRLQTWISIALRHSLESLKVGCTGIIYPDSLLNSTSLRKLDLCRTCTLNVAAKNIAANLSSLYLHGVKIVNGNPNTSTVAFTFVVLETFTVRACEWLNVKTVEIYAPSLVTFMSEPANTFDVKDYEYSFVIVAPRLATFTCSCGIPEEFILDGSSIVTANLLCGTKVDDHDLQLCRKLGLRVVKLLNELTSLKELQITRFIAEVSQYGPPLHRHDKLERLSFLDPCQSGLPFHVLHAAPSLKFLSFNLYDVVDYDYEEIETVPSCIVSQLEEVHFCGFFCETPQYNAVKFLLKNGERLKKIYLKGIDCDMQNEVTEILLGFPGQSPCSIIAQ